MAIFTAIASAVLGFVGISASATILGVSASALLGGALAIGASFALQKLTQKKLDIGQTAQAQATLNQSTGPRVRGYGRAKLGGTRAFWDSKNGILHQAVMAHSGQIDGFEEWWIGDIRVTVADDGRVTTQPYFNPSGNQHYAYLFAHDGSNTQAADGVLVANYPAVWTPAHQLKGIAYFVSAFVSPAAEDYQVVFPEGYNSPVRTVARLSRVYDPRTGATAWSDNAALCILDYLTHPDGFGRNLNDIDLASFSAFANICGEPIPLSGGGVEPRYRLWGVYNLAEDPQDVLDRMRETCDAELYQTASGKIAIRGGKWVEPTVTITADDILGHQLEQGNNRFAAFNELKILYTSPAHDYQAMEAASWVDVEAQAEQGPLLSDLSLDLVPSHSQALRLAKIHIAKSNPRWRGSITTNLSGLNALGERTIYVQLPELGIDEPFLVTGFSISPDLTGCEIGITSLDASAYEWNPATEQLDPAPVPQDTRPDLVLPSPEGLTLRVLDRQGGPVIRATVDPSGRADLQLAAEFRPAGGQWEAMTAATGALEAFSGVATSGVTYEVRARWLTAQSAAGQWSSVRTILVVANAVAPAAPTAFTAAKQGASAKLSWTNPSTAGFYFVRIYRGTTSTFSQAAAISEVYGSTGLASTYTDPAPGTGARYYWLEAVNVAGAPSPTAGPQSLTF
jgi:hypothetical protein